jgi:3-methylfumaryl-CoA hydratase
VNEALTRCATIEKIDEKGGRMAFVTVSHEVHGENGLAIRESQNIVYLAMPEKFDPPAKRAMPEKLVFENHLAMPSTLLFRFSAITFNAHRIHYDLPYAQDIEKYPGLVVHGPLQAMFLAKAASDQAKTELRSFQFRGIHPAFHFDDLAVCAEQPTSDNSLSLYAGVPAGHQTMQAQATWQKG